MKIGNWLFVLFGCMAWDVVAPSSLLASLPSAQSVTRDKPAVATPLVEVTKGRMTVKLKNVSLLKLLAIAARKTGARIVLHGPADETVSMAFQNLPVEEGLRRLLGGRNTAHFYSVNASGAVRSADITLREVLVFGSSTGASREFRVITASQSAPDQKNGRAAGKIARDFKVQSGDGEYDPFIAELAQQLLEEKNSAVRKAAAENLGKTWSEDAVAPLSEAASQDPDAAVRAAAAKALGETWSEEAVAPLTYAMLQDTSAAVREAAAHALGRSWSENAVSSLVAALMQDSDALVREQAARALSQTAGEEAVSALADALIEDPRWFVRDAAAAALGSIGGSDALHALESSLAYDIDAWVRETAALSVMNVSP